MEFSLSMKILLIALSLTFPVFAQSEDFSYSECQELTDSHPGDDYQVDPVLQKAILTCLAPEELQEEASIETPHPEVVSH